MVVGLERAAEGSTHESPAELLFDRGDHPARPRGAVGDTVYVGHSTAGAAIAPWYVYTGPYRPDPNDPSIPGNRDGYWGWDNFNPSLNDSLMGWWPIRRLYTITGGLTLADSDRPWWAIDAGNVVNYVLSSRQQDRTFGVNGVWHVDPGNVITEATPGTNPVAPGWAPISGSGSAWCGLRGHGDLTVIDAVAQGGYGNPFNSDAHMFMDEQGGGSGTNKNWPGYASQWDQMLYRDFRIPADASLTVSFDYQTRMSMSANSTAATQTGWFDGDPRSMGAGNFISASAAGANRPADSLMVYVGQPVDVNACLYSDGQTDVVFDVRRRWKNEVLKRNATKEILSLAGTTSGSETQTISAADLAPYRDAIGRVRLCFRVKTNRGFDDTGSEYSSGGAGAVVIDNVVVDHSGTQGVEVTSGFETASEIDNTPQANGYALTSWRSTGKPPSMLAHTHPLDGGDIGGGNWVSPLSYTDLCGPPSSPARFCNIYSVVISVGDHDNNEAAGGSSATFMPGDRETMEGIVSPTINLMSAGPADFNSMGINSDIADVSDDYYIFYDMFAGVYNLFFTGNAWTFGFQSYPATQLNGSRAWGEFRVPGFQIFNPEPQCFTDWEPAYQNGLIATSNANSIPDSLRIMLGKNQQCFRFAVTAGCSPTEGTYFDNVSLACVDAPPAQATAVGAIGVDPWQWINDAFPNNETAGLPGTAAFDTCAANLKTGLNTAQATGTAGRFDIPGDSTCVTATGAGMRVDMVFRILPGVGNYVTVGNRNSGVRRVPTSPTAATPNDGSFFGSYLGNNGEFGSPAGHPGGVWSKDVWNSARVDTAEMNYFPVGARGDLSRLTPGAWSSTYHESDPKLPILGIAHPVCFLVDTAGATDATNTTCTTVPAWATTIPHSGYDASTAGLTKEGTKILPDGLLTPGAHVQYFFRKSRSAAPSEFVASPDTNRIFPQNSERSADGHRWQQFGVLPDRWKDPSFGGQGMGCALVVDLNDRRGNERVFISTADSICANLHWGAHNGWRVLPGYLASNLTQDYTNEIVGGDPTIARWDHGGQPGTTFDLYQVKASESLTAQAGGLGSRLANRAGMGLAAGKESRQGPTAEMLRTYYRLLVILSGDLTSGILGPFVNRSQNDVSLITDFLTNSSGSATPRGLHVVGDGFAQSETQTAGVNPAHGTLLTTYLACSLRDPSYQSVSANLQDVADLIPTNLITTNGDVYGVRNTCRFSNDLLHVNGAVPGAAAASFYENFGPNGPYVASVYAPSSVTRPWVSLIDGWEIEHHVSRDGATSRPRLRYWFDVQMNVMSSLCSVGPYLFCILDVPSGVPPSDFLALGVNPVTSGQGRIVLGLSVRKHLRVQLFDVAGRLVRTLANRSFEPGQHTLVWDGADDGGRVLARGMYFVRVRGLDGSAEDTQKLVFLR